MKTSLFPLFPTALSSRMAWWLGFVFVTFALVPARAVSESWDAPPNAVVTANGLRAVAYSGKQFVAVGGTSGVSFVETSKNARDWTQRTSPVAANLNDVAWSGTVFAAVGEGGKIITSPDGIAWTSRSSGVAADLNAIVWAGTQFVAVGDSTILTSANGTTWTKKTAPPATDLPDGYPYDRNFLDVAWTGSKLVVISAADVTTSSNGSAWTRQLVDNFPVGGGSSIAWNGSVLVRVGTDSSSVDVSSNGLQWTSPDVSGVVNGVLRGVGAVAGVFYAVGNDSVIVSKDGVNWEADTTPGYGDLVAIGGGVPTVIAVGDDGVLLARGDLGTDGPIVASFTESNVSVDEGAGNLVLTVRLSDVAPAALTIPFTLKHNSTSAKDIKAPVSPLKFKEGNRQLQIVIPIISDVLDEEDEDFTVTLGAGSGYSLDDAKSCNVTIVDDDTAPSITMLSGSQVVAVGDQPELSVLAEGSAPLVVQWRKKGVSIKGAVGENYSIENITVLQAGQYDAQAKNPVGLATTVDKVEIAVVDTADKYPTVLPGGIVTLTANYGASPGTVTFQWQKDGADLANDTGPNPRVSGATSSTLKIKNATSEDAAGYACIVTQAATGNSLASGNFFLNVVTAKPILMPLDLPAGQVLRPFSYQVEYDTTPTNAPGKFTANGLPPGLIINADTGEISGIPTAPLAGKSITVTATNAKGAASVSGPLNISALPGIGSYQGLVSRESEGAWPGSELGARVQIDVTSAGAYTGKLLNGGTISFKGQFAFDDEGNLTSTTTVPLPGKNAPVLTLAVLIDVATDTLTGQLTLNDAAVEVNGWRNVWTSGNPPTAFLGQFNFIMANGADSLPNVPGGDGYGTFKVTASGSFDIKGKLPDGTPLLCNTFVGPRGQVLLYQPLYANPGSVIGRMEIGLPSEDIAFPVIFQDEPASWNKPRQTAAADKTYKSGFEIISLVISGGIYKAPAPGQVVMGLGEVQSNAALHLNGYAIDGTENPPDVVFTISNTGSVIMPPQAENPAKITFTVNPATGEFSGGCTLLDPDPSKDAHFTRSAKYYGLISFTANGPVAAGMVILPQVPDPFAEPVITAANAQTLSARVYLEPNPDAAQPIVVSLADPALILGEGDGTVSLLVTLTEPFASKRTIPIAITHGQTVAADFTLNPLSVTFLAGETEASIDLKITQDSLDEDDEQFTLTLVDGTGYDVDGASGACVITIVDDDTKASFTKAPLPQILSVGDPLFLETEVEGDQPMAVQWRKNTVALPGQSGLSFSVNAVQLADGGSYDVAATNLSGVTTSDKAEVVVVDPTEHPVAVKPSLTATFAANFTGPATGLTFQWQQSGVDLVDDAGTSGRIKGATTQQLVIKNVTDADSDDYTCVITQSSSANSVTTGIYHLHVVAAKPVLDPFEPPNGSVAAAFIYQVSFDLDSERRPATISATGLPAGLVINPYTGLIAGTPTAAGTSNVTITATNGYGSAVVSGQIVIAPLDPNVIGTYHGYVGRAEGVMSDDEPPVLLVPWSRADLGARLEITTTPSGSYSGKLLNGDAALNFAGQISDEGGVISSTTLVIRPGLPPLHLELFFDAASNSAGGTFGIDETLVELSAWRNVWSPANPAVGLSGRFNFSIQNSDSPSETVPGGFGYGSLTIPAKGIGTFDVKGRLPDGSPFICNTFLGPNGEILLFQPLYTQPGSVLGFVAATPDTGSGAGITSVILNWSKPPQSDPAERSYKDGITMQGLVVLGGLYVPPTTTEIPFNLADQNDNAFLYFADGGLANSESAGFDGGLRTVFRLLPGGSAIMPGALDNPALTTFTLDRLTGAYSGTFTLTDHDPDTNAVITRLVNYSGLITLNEAGALCPGFFTLPQLADPTAEPPTTLATSPILTGSVQLGVN